MPLYDFGCSKCGHTCQRLCSFKESERAVKCKCGATMKKKVSLPAVARFAVKTGFASNGRLIKENPDLHRRVRQKYFGDDTDSKTFVK